MKRKHIEIQYDEPENWKTFYERIKEMRKDRIAPVDSMGCAMWNNGDKSTPAEGRVNTLWSLMLSSQTKDACTAEAMRNLAATGSKVTDILKYTDQELDKKIEKVGFHNKKVKYLKATAKILHEKYQDDVPPTLEGILELPGVGPKMAYLLMTHAWDKPIGIGVDVHVHRICNRFNWVKTDTPEQTRVAWQAWVSKEYWGKDGINTLLVGFGQTICTPVGPKCSQCTLKDICPSSSLKTPKSKNGDKSRKEKADAKPKKASPKSKEKKKSSKNSKRKEVSSSSAEESEIEESESDEEYKSKVRTKKTAKRETKQRASSKNNTNEVRNIEQELIEPDRDIKQESIEPEAILGIKQELIEDIKLEVIEELKKELNVATAVKTNDVAKGFPSGRLTAADLNLLQIKKPKLNHPPSYETGAVLIKEENRS